MEAHHEVVQVSAPEWVRFERVMNVSAVVIDPEFFCPGTWTRWHTIEEQHVGFDALRVEDAGR
jgi:hypothetical protein